VLVKLEASEFGAKPESTVRFTQCSAVIECASKSRTEEGSNVFDLICPINMSMNKIRAG